MARDPADLRELAEIIPVQERTGCAHRSLVAGCEEDAVGRHRRALAGELAFEPRAVPVTELAGGEDRDPIVLIAVSIRPQAVSRNRFRRSEIIEPREAHPHLARKRRETPLRTNAFERKLAFARRR